MSLLSVVRDVPLSVWRGHVWLGVCLLALTACVSAPQGSKGNTNAPAQYQVRSGDTVSKIAQRYGLDWREVSRLNNLDANHTIYVGQWLTLYRTNKKTAAITYNNKVVVAQAPPDQRRASSTAKSSTSSSKKTTKTFADIATSYGNERPVIASPSNAAHIGSSGVMQFRYPVGRDNKVARQSGVDVGGSVSEGMFFMGKAGDVVTASQSGTVVYADKHAPAGERSVVMIQHQDGYTSSYFDIKNIQVSTGQSVRVGDSIGVMQQMHGNVALFEFRMAKNGRYIDPISVLH